jgi:uncharacterized protein (TIGR02147 family)
LLKNQNKFAKIANMDLFAFTEYRTFLKNWVSHHPEGNRGLLTKMAKAIGCQNSHLSRVLRDEVQLTPDQAYQACEFMKLSNSETNYFLKMVELERAGNFNYKKRIKGEMLKIKVANENLAERFQEESIGHEEKELLYYSNWHWSAVHILTDVSKYQTSKKISERLSIDETVIRNCLETLARFGLVKKEGEMWQINSGSVHLSKNSPMNSVQHSNWRGRAALDSQNPNTDGIHYTMVQSISLADFEKIKVILFNAIDSYRKVADQSPPEEVTCLAFDFFKI